MNEEDPFVPDDNEVPNEFRDNTDSRSEALSDASDFDKGGHNSYEQTDQKFQVAADPLRRALESSRTLRQSMKENKKKMINKVECHDSEDDGHGHGPPAVHCHGSQGASDVQGLSTILYFYKQLNHLTHVKTDEQSQWWYRMHKRYLSRIKLLVLFSYVFVLPFLEAPQWCIDKIK